MITEREIDQLTYERQVTVNDDGRLNYPRQLLLDSAGFGVEVNHAGYKHYFVRYKLDGKRLAMSLGATKLMTLAEAREKAEKIRTEAKQGIDPLQPKKELAQKIGISFAEACAGYCQKKPDAAVCLIAAISTFGSRKIRKICERDVNKFINDQGLNNNCDPDDQGALIEHLTGLFNFAAQKGWVHDAISVKPVKITIPEFIPLNTAQTQAPTLAEAFADLLENRKLKEGTAKYYERIISIYLRDWFDVSLSSITRDSVRERHNFITKASGPTSANVTMRILSSVFNYSIFRFRTLDNKPMLEENPVVMLTQLRSWNKLKPKHRVIKKDELARWYRSVQACKSDNLRDSLLLMLFTGLRKSETASLEWKNVDFVDRSFTVVDTKNGKDHCLPMSSFVYDMLWQRHENARCGWVFPNKTINGPMSSTNSTYERIGFKCGITFSPHDLRRSFLLVARTVGLDHYTLKHLLNHAGVRDITFSCYTVRDIENLREPVEKISQAMKFYLGITPEVIPASVLMIDAGGADVPSLELSR